MPFVTGALKRGFSPGATVMLLVLIVSFPAMADITTTRQDELRHMVEHNCGSCHGLTRGGGLGAPLSEKALENRSPEELFKVIRNGIKGTPMPPWKGQLKDEEIRWIVKMLKGDF